MARISFIRQAPHRAGPRLQRRSHRLKRVELNRWPEGDRDCIAVRDVGEGACGRGLEADPMYWARGKRWAEGTGPQAARGRERPPRASTGPPREPSRAQKPDVDGHATACELACQPQSVGRGMERQAGRDRVVPRPRLCEHLPAGRPDRGRGGRLSAPLPVCACLSPRNGRQVQRTGRLNHGDRLHRAPAARTSEPFPTPRHAPGGEIGCG